MAINQFIPGEPLDAVRLNQIVDLANANESNAELANTKADQVRGDLNNQYVEEIVTLWTGNSYLDGSTNYNLWSSGLHRQWDVVKVHVKYDPAAYSGTGGEIFEVYCGPSYNFNEQDSQAHSTLFTTYDQTYRRLCITTNGINIVNGNGGGWYLTRVEGVVRKKLNY